MSKGLKAWERIKKGIDTNVWECGYWDDIDIIEKELKALEIIKNKKVNMLIFMGSDTLEEYNKHPLTFDHLTETEFDLIKEWLER